MRIILLFLILIVIILADVDKSTSGMIQIKPCVDNYYEDCV